MKNEKQNRKPIRYVENIWLKILSSSYSNRNSTPKPVLHRNKIRATKKFRRPDCSYQKAVQIKNVRNPNGVNDLPKCLLWVPRVQEAPLDFFNVRRLDFHLKKEKTFNFFQDTRKDGQNIVFL